MLTRLSSRSSTHSTLLRVLRRKQPWDLESRRGQSQSCAKTLRGIHHVPRPLAALPRPTSKQHFSDQCRQKLCDNKSDLTQPVHKAINHRPRENRKGNPSGHVAEPFLGESHSSHVSHDIPMPPPLLQSWRFGGLTASKEKPLRSHDNASEAAYNLAGGSCEDGWRLPDVPRLTSRAEQQLSPAWKAGNTTCHEPASFPGTTPFVTCSS